MSFSVDLLTVFYIKYSNVCLLSVFTYNLSFHCILKSIILKRCPAGICFLKFTFPAYHTHTHTHMTTIWGTSYHKSYCLFLHATKQTWKGDWPLVNPWECGPWGGGVSLAWWLMILLFSSGLMDHSVPACQVALHKHQGW